MQVHFINWLLIMSVFVTHGKQASYREITAFWNGRLRPPGMLLSLTGVNFIVITAENLKSDKRAKRVLYWKDGHCSFVI
jgi:hypothetical protein